MMQVNNNILVGRRKLEEIDNVNIIDDLKWDDKLEKWYIHIEICISNSPDNLICENTRWYIVFSNDYPEGEVNIYPAVLDGIENTYNHQNNNGKISDNGLWRSGRLCLNNPFEEFSGTQKEFTDYIEKLYWNVKRAVQWVNAASKGELIHIGDYYELPDFIIKEPYCVVYNEDLVSKMEWEDSESDFGYVDIVCGNNYQYFAKNFYTVTGKICKTTKWGKYVEDKQDIIKGAWILLEQEPVIKNWQAPINYGELEIALELQSVDYKKTLEKLLPLFRDGRRHIVMIGFPVPNKIGEDKKMVCWEAFLLPVVSKGKKTAKGFRNNEKGWIRRDFQEVITKSNAIDWLITENWNSKEILNRGQFKEKFVHNRILLIGAGTLGAGIGENLVRGGVYKLTIMDDDIYEIGNSARHILSIDSVGKNKAAELVKHYNSINPNVEIKAINNALEFSNTRLIEGFDIIIDCTASNNVLKVLSQYKTTKAKKYFSVSFGYMAKKMYFAYHLGEYFNMDRFVKEFKKYIEDDIKSIEYDKMPWKGTGCWNPVFPAMAAEVQMISSFSVQLMREIIENNICDDKYYIFNRHTDKEGVLQGFVRL